MSPLSSPPQLQSRPKIKVGYIGLGHAGYPMAANLARSGSSSSSSSDEQPSSSSTSTSPSIVIDELIVRDADPERARKFVEEFSTTTTTTEGSGSSSSSLPPAPGGTGSGTSEGKVKGKVRVRMAEKEGGEKAFEDVDVLVTMLPNGTVVRDVLLGTRVEEGEGIGRGLKRGTVVIDTSSSSPFHTRSLAQELKSLDNDIELIDSPITQSRLHAIADAGATLMVGSDSPAALDTAMPVLRVMSRYVFVMGGLGAGHAMKTLNNYVSVGSIIALCDALVAGQKFGLDPGQMIDVLNVGTGRNFSTAYSMRDEGLTRRFATGYQLALLIKDMNITKELIESVGFDTELPDLSIRYLEHASRLVAPDADHTECLKGWEQRAGVQLRKTNPEPEPEPE